jgi:hypothetical protein
LAEFVELPRVCAETLSSGEGLAAEVAAENFGRTREGDSEGIVRGKRMMRYDDRVTRHR